MGLRILRNNADSGSIDRAVAQEAGRGGCGRKANCYSAHRGVQMDTPVIKARYRRVPLLWGFHTNTTDGRLAEHRGYSHVSLKCRAESVPQTESILIELTRKGWGLRSLNKC